MRVLDLFSGIGGFSLGLERAGMETVAFCEFDKHAQAVLKKHWPNVPIFEDVRTLDAKQFRGSIDVVCGGFPCQDLSNAGKKAGISGERSGLYREMLRIIGECLPRYAIFENVSALLSGDKGRWFAQFLYDLASLGYDAEWHCISASFIGAPHHRDRIWIIAYPNDNGQSAAKVGPGFREGNDNSKKRKESASELDGLFSKGISANTESWDDRKCKQRKTERQKQEFGKSACRAQIFANANANVQRCERFAKVAHHLKQQIELMRSSEDDRRRFNLSEPALCGANDGVPRRLDRLKRLGNAVVPQIPEAIGRAIMKVEGLA